jgi:ubiquinone biosynthesis monooxygenase Coq7
MFTKLDQCILEFDKFLRVLCPAWTKEAVSPADDYPETDLSGLDKHQSVAMMRVNVAGEVAAQGLYRGQLLLAQNDDLRADLKQAADEEMEHYAWCMQRLQQLDARASIFNPIWYAGAFSLGLLAAMLGDKQSLGFIIATEEQVGRHLASHLQALSSRDLKSRAIVRQMHQDELAHAEEAEIQGGLRLPGVLQELMHWTAQVMIKASRLV